MAGTTPSAYVLGATETDRELRRLRLIEEDCDFFSQARLRHLGLSPGMRCLEVGVGVGSMARWMSEQVGADGMVVGVDINDRFFHLLSDAAVELRQTDVRTADLPAEEFDFIHARCLMMHVPDTAEVLQNMLRWLKPGGWVVLGDYDASFFLRANGPGELYNRMHKAAADLFARSGGHPAIGTELPHRLAESGFRSIGANGSFPLVLPWGTQAELLALNMETVRALTPIEGARDEDFDAFYASLPHSLETGLVFVMSWAQRPPSQSTSSSEVQER